jgi:nucleotide-binding universal stress UspA family protein
MTTFDKILVPVDFSPHSADAVSVAAAIAGAYAGAVTIVHVFDPLPLVLPEGRELYTHVQQTQLLQHLERRLAVVKRAAEAAGAPAVRTRVLQGPPAATILEFALAEAFELVVMGTHGRTGVQHALIGSVAEKVVRHSRCPVLSVRAQGELAKALCT